jgi:hypothetical protein
MYEFQDINIRWKKYGKNVKIKIKIKIKIKTKTKTKTKIELIRSKSH